MQIRRMQGRKTIIAPHALDGEIPDAPEPGQPALIQALARAFAWTELIESGQVKSIAALARALDVDGSYVARILKLTTLAPDIIQAILNGEEPDGLSLAKLTKTLPEDWAEQHQVFEFSSGKLGRLRGFINSQRVAGLREVVLRTGVAFLGDRAVSADGHAVDSPDRRAGRRNP